MAKLDDGLALLNQLDETLAVMLTPPAGPSGAQSDARPTDQESECEACGQPGAVYRPRRTDAGAVALVLARRGSTTIRRDCRTDRTHPLTIAEHTPSQRASATTTGASRHHTTRSHRQVLAACYAQYLQTILQLGMLTPPMQEVQELERALASKVCASLSTSKLAVYGDEPATKRTHTVYKCLCPCRNG